MATNSNLAIEVCNLAKRFDEVEAVAGISFNVLKGELFGFLGPNGAGKTTTVRMLTGYIAPTAGTALVDGHDIVSDSTLARQHLGVVPEEANVYVDLTVWENVMLMAELHSVPRRRRVERGRELLELFGLGDRLKQRSRALSKGLRQRLMVCMALVSDPAILFLDEPTSGLDVASTRLIRELILRVNRERGMTVFLTTHNMEEAEHLSRRVAIINRGRIAAIDTPDILRRTVESRRSVEVTFAGQALDSREVAALAGAEGFAEMATGFRVYGSEPGLLAQRIVSKANERRLRVQSIRTLEPTLEEVFVHITGGPAAENKEVEQ
jgi:ABC-2 type transport system ATP-binding protein